MTIKFPVTFIAFIITVLYFWATFHLLNIFPECEILFQNCDGQNRKPIQHKNSGLHFFLVYNEPILQEHYLFMSMAFTSRILSVMSEANTVLWTKTLQDITTFSTFFYCINPFRSFDKLSQTLHSEYHVSVSMVASAWQCVRLNLAIQKLK